MQRAARDVRPPAPTLPRNRSRLTVKSLCRHERAARRELSALHDALWGKAVALVMLWSIAGGPIAGWAWWRVLITLVVGSTAAALIVGIGSALPEANVWPATLRERARAMSSFAFASLTLLIISWWMTNNAAFLQATAAFVLAAIVWAFPSKQPPTSAVRSERALPAGLAEFAKRLPKHPAPELERTLDEALQDWQHLHDVLETDEALEEMAEAPHLRATADATLLSVFSAGTRAAELERIAAERPDDNNAPKAAVAALHDARRRGTALHDMTSTLLRFVTTHQRSEHEALRQRVDELSALAELEVELHAPSERRTTGIDDETS